jgi:hypothetical protein
MVDPKSNPSTESRSSVLVFTPREPMIPLGDDEIAMAVRVALRRAGEAVSDPGGAGNLDAQAKGVAEHFRRSGILVFWSRSRQG